MSKKLVTSDLNAPIFNRLVEICESNNTTVTALLDEFTTSRGIMTTWKKGNISIETICKIANKFNLSLDALVLGHEPEIPADYQMLISLYDKLSPDNKEVVKHLMNSMIEIQDK